MKAISQNSPEGTEEKHGKSGRSPGRNSNRAAAGGNRESLPTEPVVSVKIPLKNLKKQRTASSTEQCCWSRGRRHATP
jgi:hypothetical protein